MNLLPESCCQTAWSIIWANYNEIKVKMPSYLSEVIPGTDKTYFSFKWNIISWFVINMLISGNRLSIMTALQHNELLFFFLIMSCWELPSLFMMFYIKIKGFFFLFFKEGIETGFVWEFVFFQILSPRFWLLLKNAYWFQMSVIRLLLI